MKLFARLTLLTLGMVILLGLYFEFIVNRPMNLYLQYAASAVMIIVTGIFLYYLVKQLIRLLNP